VRAHRRSRHPLFGQPIARANYGYWAKVAHWHPGEAAALSLGYAPKVVNLDTVRPYLQSSSKAQEFDSRLMLISRALEMGALSQQFRPHEFVAWADGIIKLPKRLRNAVAKIPDAHKGHCEAGELRKQRDQCKAANEDPSPRELHSLLKIIAGMALGRYGFNPKADRNSATQAIVDDVERLGLSIDNDTVLQHLRRICSELGI